jgi:uncharacterized membrane protein YbaN (DUF454 family)
VQNATRTSLHTDMNVQVKRAAILILGWCFILLGVVGLFLPILQGVLFLLVGLIILSSEYVWAHQLLAKVRQRFPKISATADAATKKAARWLRHLSRQREHD